MKNKYMIFAVLVAIVPSYSGANPYHDNAIPNVDGTRTILRGQQLPTKNSRHQKFCEQMGAVDVTNEGEVTLGPNVQDFVLCQRPVGPVPSTGALLPNNVEFDQVVSAVGLRSAPSWLPPLALPREPASPFASTPFPTISVYPNNGYSTKIGYVFYPASYAVFRNMPKTGQAAARIESLIPDFGCNWVITRWIPPGDTQVDGYVACVPTKVGTIPTSMTACASLACARGEGRFAVVKQ